MKLKKISGIVFSAGLLTILLTSSSGSGEGVPFWGTDCDYIGVVGGIGGSPCYEYSVCTKYRFWINFGSSDAYNEVPCP
jgi:hypothetical protein